MVVSHSNGGFFDFVVAWQKAFGRNNLPWQNTNDPYRVLVSEVMLQQTQVSAVVEYYNTFIRTYPDVNSLANADLDDVFRLWSGLGYYSRARNLLRSAKMIVDDFGGVFPGRVDDLIRLPGVGFSTAAAISAFCFGEKVSIFDGNVKRVTSRYFGYNEDISLAKNTAALQKLVQDLLPKSAVSHRDMIAYTQGLMDLGAMVCKPRKTDCHLCPVHEGCVARRSGSPMAFPFKSKKIHRRCVSWNMWIFQRSVDEYWVERRSDHGIWAGLYCFPITMESAAPISISPERIEWRGTLDHALTHLDISISYHLVTLSGPSDVYDLFDRPGVWVGLNDFVKIGVPQPVRRIIDTIS